MTPPADSAACGFPPVCFSHVNCDTIQPFRDCHPLIGRFVGRPRVNLALAAALRSCSFSPHLRVVHNMLNFILAPVVVHTQLFLSSYCVLCFILHSLINKTCACNLRFSRSLCRNCNYRGSICSALCFEHTVRSDDHLCHGLSGRHLHPTLAV